MRDPQPPSATRSAHTPGIRERSGAPRASGRYPMLLIDPYHIEPRRLDAAQAAAVCSVSDTHLPRDDRWTRVRSQPYSVTGNCTHSSRGARSGFVGERRQLAPLARSFAREQGPRDVLGAHGSRARQDEGPALAAARVDDVSIEERNATRRADPVVRRNRNQHTRRTR